MDFSLILKLERTKQRITQKELARICGISNSHLSHFESGARRPSFDNLIKIADALDVSLDKLVGRKDEA